MEVEDEEEDDAVGGAVFSFVPLFLFWLQMSPAPDSRNQGGSGFLVVEAAALLLQA